jgi:tetratricopeptide (TPR) repeat protein
MAEMEGYRLGVALALLGLSCGGSAPPAQTGGGTPGSTSAPTGGATPPTTSVPEPPTTAEMTAGTKAFDAGDYAGARKSFEAAVKKNPQDYQSFFNLGETCEKLGDKPAAEAAYKSAIAIKPDLDNAAANLCALYLDEGRIDDALAVGRAGLASHPGSAALHENLGVALAAKGDQDNASKEFSQAVQSAPNDPMMHLTFAHWLNVWKIRGAAPHLDAALPLVKDDYGMIVSIGFEYRMAGEFDSCIKTLDRAVSMKDGGEVRTYRALCKLGLKDEKGTFDDLQAAVTKEPSYAQAHYYLGGRLAVAKRFKEAAAEYAKYLQLAPNGSLAEVANQKLKAAQDAAKDKGGKKK